MRALVVEDDRRLSDIVSHVLERDGYGVDAVFDGANGLEYARSGIYDVVILDVMLPGMNGFGVVKGMRSESIETPVLMLTAKSAVADRIEGLDMGADNYMTKPFSPKELLARLRALTRRNAGPGVEKIKGADLELDPASYALSCGSESVQLSYQEYRVAELFVRNPGRTFSRSQIASHAWDVDADVKDNSIDAYVSLLRKKLRYIRSSAELRSERGVGYKLEASMQETQTKEG